MTSYTVLYSVRLEEHHRPTGRTLHTAGNEQLPAPDQLAIAKYPDDGGFYLLYLDCEGTEITDTFHETVDDAMTQAEWEFGVLPPEWRRA